MVTVWAATPLTTREDFEQTTVYINLRALKANIQTDYSELDLKEYGDTVKEMVKLRFDRVPQVANRDMVYLIKPVGLTKTVGGTEVLDFGKGDYELIDVKPGFWQRSRNPVTIRAKAVVK